MNSNWNVKKFKIFDFFRFLSCVSRDFNEKIEILIKFKNINILQ